jgi:hypothetical protein
MKITRIGLGICVAFALGACTNDVTLSGQPTIPSNFIQIAQTGRDLAINLFTPWNDHLAINKGNLNASGGVISNDIGTFMQTTAGRSAAITTQAQTLLVPNVLIADLSQSGNASYLGVETAGKLNKNGTVCGTSAAGASPCTGGLFGGRDTVDDVGASMLGIAFGPLIPQLFPTIPDDGKEQTSMPNLANDNVAGPTTINPVYPYFPAPH